MIDGTTLYFDGSAPKINVAPSTDNATPEAIQPTVVEQRARPTEVEQEVELEGSVGEVQEQEQPAQEKSAEPVVPAFTPPSTTAKEDNEKMLPVRTQQQGQVEVPVPNTSNYPPAGEPSLDSHRIEAARVEQEEQPFTVDEQHPVVDEDSEVDEDLEGNVDQEEDQEDDQEEQAEDEERVAQEFDQQRKNKEVIEEMRSKHLEEEQLKVQQKIKEMMAKIDTEVPANPEVSTDAAEPIIADPMTTPSPVEPEPEQKVVKEVSTDNAPEIPAVEVFKAAEVPDVEKEPFTTEDKPLEGIGAQGGRQPSQPEEQSKQAGMDHHHGHHHGHDHGHNDIHSHGHGLGNGHEDDGFHHDHLSDDHGHSHDGHSHDGHSHDGHGHSHGMGHLGRGVRTTPSTQKAPEYYKPAEQQFELPLSARFGGASSYSGGQEATPAPLQEATPAPWQEATPAPLQEAVPSNADHQAQDFMAQHQDLQDPKDQQDLGSQYQDLQNPQAQYQDQQDPGSHNQVLQDHQAQYHATPSPEEYRDTDQNQVAQAPGQQQPVQEYFDQPDQVDQVDQPDHQQHGQSGAEEQIAPGLTEPVATEVKEEAPGIFERISNFFAGSSSKDLTEKIVPPPSFDSIRREEAGAG